MTTWALFVLLTVQGADPRTEALRLMQQWLDAVNLYRAGQVEEGVRGLESLTPAQQERAVDYLRATFLALKQDGVKARPAGFRWEATDLVAAAALHMEAALALTNDPEPAAIERIRAHVALAEKSFGVAAIAGGSAATHEKWLLAIGLRMTAEGRFGRAQDVLRGALAEYPDSADVQLAWGTLREIEATVPPEGGPDSTAATAAIAPRRIGPRARLANMEASADVAQLQIRAARAMWDASAREAHQALARAAQLAPASAEAQLRLAHVEMLQEKDASAAARLEPIVATATDRRMAYLSRLFLADISQRGNDRPRAEALLEQAIGLVPSGQAAHLALAQLARDGGDFERAAVLLHRMMNAPIRPDDPWVTYRFGQFWVADGLIRQLREEARKAS